MSLELYRGVRDLFVGEDGATKLILDGIPFGDLTHVCIYQMLNPNLEFPSSRRRIAKILKRRGVDWQVRFLSGRLFGGKRDDSNATGPRGFVLFTIYNQAVINSLVPVYKVLSESDIKAIAIYSDPGMRSALPESVSGICYSSHYKASDEVEVRKKWRQLEAQLNAYKETLKRRLHSLNKGAPEDVERVISFLNPFLKQCLRDAQAIRNLIDRLQPGYILMGSDANKLGRLFSIIARRRGIRSVVIQHGATVDPYGYVPVYADRAAIWGNISKAWYMAHRVPEAQLAVTGNPQLSNLKLQANEPERPDKKVILATNPLAMELNESIIKTVVEVASKHRVSLKLRPHPSEDPALYRNSVRHYQQDIEVCVGPLDELIGCGDIVITCNSTIGIDALIRGAFLVVIDIPDVKAPIPYSEYGVAETVSLSATEIDRVLAAYLEGSLRRDEGKTQVFLNDYTGSLDGKAASRIARILIN